MPLYRYQSGSTIDEVAILKNESGGRRACLHASPGASAAQLSAIRKGMESNGWTVVPLTHEGKAVLEVRGFKNPNRLLQQLSQQGWIGTQTSTETQPGDKRTMSQIVGNATLRGAGISYIIGDLAYMTYTTKKYLDEKVHNNKTTNFFNRVDIVGGIGYGLGSLALLFYGSRDQSRNTIRAASKKIQSYLRKEGVTPEPDSALSQNAAEPKRTFWGHLDHTFAKYPSETLNSVYVGVGGALSSAAIYRALKAQRLGNKKDRNTEIIDIGLGAVTAASALAGLLIKEKRPEDGEQKRTGIAGVWDWIQEKPLRATGYGYMIATLFHGTATVKKLMQNDGPEKEQIKKTFGYRAIFVVANVISEFFLTFSSKGHGTGVKPDDSIDRTVIASTAAQVLQYDPSRREGIIQQLAGYMASRDVLDGKADDIATQLRAQVSTLEHNPWNTEKSAPLQAAPQAPAQPGNRIAQATRVAALAAPHAAIAGPTA